MTQTRTAFVTGATAGIGEATVRTLVANGWRCVATGRRQERLDALVADLGEDKVHSTRASAARNCPRLQRSTGASSAASSRGKL